MGGKGGVGKTTTAAALALRLAREGRSTLLVSTDPAHSLGDLFDTRIGDRAVEVAPGLHAMELDPEAEVERYLDQVRENMQGFVSPDMYPEIERQLKLTRRSPGAVEAATLDRISHLMADPGEGYDVVVFDTAPTGHTLRLLSLPELMAAWTDGLLRHRERSDSFGDALQRLAGDELSYIDQVEEGKGGDPRSRKIREVLLERRRRFMRARRLLLDPQTTAFIWVLIPERLPILETARAVETLREFDLQVTGMVVNRVLPEGELGSFLEARREREAPYLEEIEERFRGIPTVRVPLLEGDITGIEGLERMGEYLGAG